MAMLKPTGVGLGGEADTHISFEDQTKINAFSRLNMKFHITKQEIKSIKDQLENLQDAGSMIEESMGEPLKLFIGECMVEVDEDAATQYQEKLCEEKQEELDDMNDKLDEIESELKGLKSFLYARFGNSINLEEDK